MPSQEMKVAAPKSAIQSIHRACKNCGGMFEIAASDTAFYQRIGVPLPTLCPDCRLQRRLAWRNEWSFYPHTCALCQKALISIYSRDKPFTIYCPSCWWGDSWDPLSYGRPFDFRRPFFDQFGELLTVVPRLPLISKWCENCEYNANITFSRNCYLSTTVFTCEDCAYCWMITRCKDVVDAYSCNDCERCYEAVNCRRCYGGVHLQNCSDCTDCALCFDCQGCRDCVGCVNLRNAERRLFNRPASKEEIAVARQSLGSHRSFEELQRKLDALQGTSPHRSTHQINTEDCSGDHISNCRRCHSCFDLEDCEDCAFCYHANTMKDSRDVFGALMGGELQYECSAAGGGMNVQFAYLSWHNTDARYLNFCEQCQHCLGCISLKHKEYCILNKQYTKEEYSEIYLRITDHMKKTGERGEFFPATISPYAYNETLAQEFFPLTKKEVLRRGWKWRDQVDEIPKVAKIFDAELLPDSIDDVPDDILNWAMTCTVTKRPYRIQKSELSFYRKMGLPVPRKHPDQRRSERMALRNPRKLFARTCAKCGGTMMTSYAPDRPEVVYCEQCYLQTVY